MTGAPFMPLAFKAENGVVLCGGREVTPAKAALIKWHLNQIGRATEDVPTLLMLDAFRLQLIAASVAAVNQRRQALHLISTREVA